MTVSVYTPVKAQPASVTPLTQNSSKTDYRRWLDTIPLEMWTKIILGSSDYNYLRGKPLVALLNSTDSIVTSVVCDGKYVMLGAKPDIKLAPASIGPRTVGLIPTDGYDKYCLKSLTATSDEGERFNVILSIPGNFTDSVYMRITPIK